MRIAMGRSLDFFRGHGQAHRLLHQLGSAEDPPGPDALGERLR